MHLWIKILHSKPSNFSPKIASTLTEKILGNHKTFIFTNILTVIYMCPCCGNQDFCEPLGWGEIRAGQKAPRSVWSSHKRVDPAVHIYSTFLLWFSVEVNVRIGNLRRNYICGVLVLESVPGWKQIWLWTCFPFEIWKLHNEIIHQIKVLFIDIWNGDVSNNLLNYNSQYLIW